MLAPSCVLHSTPKCTATCSHWICPLFKKKGFTCRPDGAWFVVMVKNCVPNETAIPLSPYWPPLDTKSLSVRTYVCTFVLRFITFTCISVLSCTWRRDDLFCCSLASVCRASRVKDAGFSSAADQTRCNTVLTLLHARD